jgi:hypothetical protein
MSVTRLIGLSLVGIAAYALNKAVGLCRRWRRTPAKRQIALADNQ